MAKSRKDLAYPYPADGGPAPDPDRGPALLPERIPIDSIAEAGDDVAGPDDLGLDPVEMEQAVGEVAQDQRLLDPSREIEPLPDDVARGEAGRTRRQGRAS
jgi:hypothetical protein